MGFVLRFAIARLGFATKRWNIRGGKSNFKFTVHPSAKHKLEQPHSRDLENNPMIA